MFEAQLNEVYKQVAQKVSDMIPEEWNSFYLNAEITNKEGGVFFFFDTPRNVGNYIYSHDIPDIFNVSEKQYDGEYDELFDLTKEMQQIFIDNDQEPWFSVTMIVNSEGKLKVHFDYINWTETEFGPTARIKYFEYKYLNKELQNEKDKELMKKMEKYEQEHS